MVRVVIALLLVVCMASVLGMPGKRVRRGYNNSGYNSERGGGGGGGYFDHGSDERDASVSREGGACSEGNYESRGSSYGRDDYNSNERRYGSHQH